MKTKSLYLSLISIVLLSVGWLGVTGLTLLGALVPLLIISGRTADTKRGWWRCFGWALLTFAGWNLATIWWIGFATPVGPVAATLFSSFYSMVAFMTYHTVSKKAPKSLSYTLLVALWIALEYIYSVGDFSWPWLLLGNGFSNDIWAVQWYEYTGIYGGSLWALISNILIFELILGGDYRRSKIVRSGVVIVAPLLFSLGIFLSYDTESGDRQHMQISVIQPNVDAYEKFGNNTHLQEQNMLELLAEVPATSQVAVLPETAIPNRYLKSSFTHAAYVKEVRDLLSMRLPNTTVIAGINTALIYKSREESQTGRRLPNSSRYVDYYNSVAAINTTPEVEMRDKARLLIGVENTPSWIFKLFDIFVIDLGGVVGQIGWGESAEPFMIDGVAVGSAICYEGLFGEFYTDFVRNGAQIMTIVSNDGWWRNTPGHKHLYSFSSLRAIETRCAIARSANTGVSGFIDERGVSIEKLTWEQRGVITHSLPLREKITTYVRYGDYIARLSIFIAILALLYYIALRAKQRHNLL